MKFTVFFEKQKRGEKQLSNTINAVQGWFYNNLSQVNPELSDWLHNQGLKKDNKIMKPINFSRLFRTSNEKIYAIKISTTIPEIQNAIVTMLNNSPTTLKICNNHFVYLDFITKTFQPTNHYYTLTPILIRGKNSELLKLNFEKSKDIEKAKKIIEKNLQWKYECIHNESCKYHIHHFIPNNMSIFLTKYRLDNENIYVYGYVGDFTIMADKPLLEIAYYYGIGYLTSSGFGCVEQK